MAVLEAAVVEGAAAMLAEAAVWMEVVVLVGAAALVKGAETRVEAVLVLVEVVTEAWLLIYLFLLE